MNKTDIPIVERLTSHMGKQDVPILLADCREAASLLKECVEALEGAREAIASLPEDALGLGMLPERHTGAATVYPIRDELLADIDATLAKVRP